MTDNTIYVEMSVASETETIDISMATETETISLIVNDGSGEMLPMYDGDYQVTPKVSEIILPTKNKSMADDVTIFQIPYHEAENPSGGITATIGLE